LNVSNVLRGNVYKHVYVQSCVLCGAMQNHET
jgi:hypothetical protein